MWARSPEACLPGTATKHTHRADLAYGPEIQSNPLRYSTQEITKFKTVSSPLHRTQQVL